MQESGVKQVETEIGKVTHYYGKIGVSVVSLTNELKVGDLIHIVGRQTDFTQKVASMQVEHKDIQSAAAGEEIGLKVDQAVREGDLAYKIEE